MTDAPDLPPRLTDGSAFVSAVQPACPPDLLARAARFAAPRMAIAAAAAPAPLEAARDAVAAGIMEPVLVGERAVIEREAEALSFDLTPFEIVEAAGEAECAEAATALVREGRADVLVKGHLHTDAFMKPAIAKDRGLRTDRRFVHVFHLSPPDGGRALMVSDAAVNVAPSMKTRQDSLRAMTELGLALGLERPRLAVLSATESVIDSMPSSVDARALQDWAAEHLPEATVRGPLALDLILSEAAARTKGLGEDPVAGEADGVQVPDIVSGNAIFKALVYVGAACAAGIVMGARAPILLTSRADPAVARLASACLAAIRCAKPKG